MWPRNLIGLLVIAGACGSVVFALAQDQPKSPDAPKPAEAARKGNFTLDDVMTWRKAEWAEGGINYAVQARAGRRLEASGPQLFVQLEAQDVRKTWIRLTADDAAGLVEFFEKPVGGFGEDAVKGDKAVQFRTLTVPDCFDSKLVLWLDYTVETGKFENNRIGTTEFAFNAKAYAEVLRKALVDLESMKKIPAIR